MSKEKSAGVEDWAAFQARLSDFSPRSRRDINFAYQLAKAAHRNQRRIGGDRYFEHVRAAAIILLDEGEIRDPDMIIVALLHDSLEDTAIFGNPLKVSHSQWMWEAKERLTINFGAEVADMVATLTKPQVDGEEILDQKQAREVYYEQLNSASPKTLIVKMADRLHNLRTQYDTSEAQQRKKVRETERIYLPLIEKAVFEYPHATVMIGAEMITAAENLKASWIRK